MPMPMERDARKRQETGLLLGTSLGVVFAAVGLIALDDAALGLGAGLPLGLAIGLALGNSPGGGRRSCEE